MVIPPEWLSHDKPFPGKWDIDTPVYSATNVGFMVYNEGSTRFLVVVYLVELSERTWYDEALAVRTCIFYIFNHTGGRKNLKWGVFGGDLSPFPVRCEGASLNPGPGYQ